MSYSSGMLRDLVDIYNRTETDGSNAWGENTGFRRVATLHASISFNRGLKAMREGALDAYDMVMIRMRWNQHVTRDSQIEHNGTRYQILSFNADRHSDTIQITAQEITT